MDRGLDVFNTLPADDVRAQLLSCCAAPDWAAAVAAARPYRDRAALAATACEQLSGLPWPQVLAAVAAHPRIGQPPSGEGREAGWSRREQAASAGGDQHGDDAARAELVTLNDAYEQRFGYRFLIFANGRGATELAAAARRRLHHDDTAEQAVVRVELGQIAALRVGRLVDDLAPTTASNAAPISTHVLDTATGVPVPGLPVRLDVADPHVAGGWRTVATGRTDADGRLRDWAPGQAWTTGGYRLVFDVAGHLGDAGFYTEIPVAFVVHDAARHHHVPLLISPYGYTTYRGS
ncbi:MULTISPECIES: 2-oxo-4-hydroxy-4-carboxy-5-ureidoimidazoline decarboxylase [unclassified Solwaraspora]|uniref:2-oxo-4-hydroxy-4-carboxy-5-ureidoimidazoline decarboxylase n=1 Tax=unclassified Solwaraspora TaxID=2627926 RepID=UPI00259B7187|nr:2-oxo-4-hydroxy-4-carboxy-5-ureidoimidazoline decarboxylase [Solwaraspora sp. WMMA2056]WJK38767.1 2-oxo-4-hydroxy-4-carboxy-5-ureidoimidazoline decarboxylase [Solwaraspora sp. WMMA2056]